MNKENLFAGILLILFLTVVASSFIRRQPRSTATIQKQPDLPPSFSGQWPG